MQAPNRRILSEKDKKYGGQQTRKWVIKWRKNMIQETRMQQIHDKKDL